MPVAPLFCRLHGVSGLVYYARFWWFFPGTRVLKTGETKKGIAKVMKHVRTITKSAVSPAQMTTGQIVGLVVTILSAVTGILTAVIPLVDDKN